MRIYLDTNMIVSAYATRGICTDLVRYALTAHELMSGEVNIVEVHRVLADTFHAPTATIRLVEADLRRWTIIAEPSHRLAIAVRDADDLVVLTSAVEAKADMLVTGDDDLLCTADHAPIPIVSPRGCWERLRR